MLTDKDKAQLLRDAIELLQEADALVQKALGPTDACHETHCEIEDICGDLRCDVIEFEGKALA
jgi:hypothetical protein